MSEAKHTPGPFEPCKPGEYSDYKGNSIVIIGDDRRIAVVLGSDEESVANASLFAAAPDLLIAAKAKLADCRLIGDCSNVMDNEFCSGECVALDAAIAKVEGRS